jgi:hypothetical protein
MIIFCKKKLGKKRKKNLSNHAFTASHWGYEELLKYVEYTFHASLRTDLGIDTHAGLKIK